jgi:hypothetical protein
VVAFPTAVALLGDPANLVLVSEATADGLATGCPVDFQPKPVREKLLCVRELLCVVQKRSIYQDRLGITTGNLRRKSEVFSAGPNPGANSRWESFRYRR